MILVVLLVDLDLCNVWIYPLVHPVTVALGLTFPWKKHILFLWSMYNVHWHNYACVLRLHSREITILFGQDASIQSEEKANV